MSAIRALGILAYAGIAYGQAAVEYALQSGRGAVSGSGTPASIGGCPVDSNLMTCLSSSYPKTTIILVVVLTIVILRGLIRTCTSHR